VIFPKISLIKQQQEEEEKKRKKMLEKFKPASLFLHFQSQIKFSHSKGK